MTRNKELTHRWSIAVAWVLAALVSLIVVFLRPDDDFTLWVLVGIGLIAVLSGALQLLTAEKEGFIVRLSLSIAGSVFILFLATLVSEFLL